MKSRTHYISRLLIASSITCGSLAFGQELIGIPDSCSDGADRLETPDGRVFVCDLESEEFGDFTPPTENAIWPITIGPGYAPPSVMEHRHNPWDFRAILIIDPSGSSRAIELDKKANIVSDGGLRPAPSHLSELYFHGVKIWPHASVLYELSEIDGLPQSFSDTSSYSIFRNQVTDGGFVVAGNNICPALQDGGFLWYLTHNPSEVALLGTCAEATQRPTGSERAGFYYYPGFDSTTPIDQQTHWIFQRHSDPVGPMRDADGICHLYCND